MLTFTNQLSAEQLNDLNELSAQCRLADGSIPNLYTHLLAQERALPANVLYYEKGKLSGFVSAFFFYEDRCEISMLVAPASRRKGLAKQLLESILPTIQGQQIKALLFSCPYQRNNDWLRSLGFEYQMSEYHMVRHDLHPALVAQKTLSFYKAKLHQIDDICQIDKACFPKSQVKIKSRLESILTDRDYQIIIAYQDQQPIGKAHIRWQNDRATFSDIGILPESQGQGFGAALLAYCINYALAEGKPWIDLDVETKNVNALNLYSRLGFKVDNACDYWLINLDHLPGLAD